MNPKEIIRSTRIRSGVQLSIMPGVVASIHQYGAANLIRSVGFAESVILLLALIGIQVYLIVARFRLDLGSGAHDR
jgi:hypothetical protein